MSNSGTNNIHDRIFVKPFLIKLWSWHIIRTLIVSTSVVTLRITCLHVLYKCSRKWRNGDSTKKKPKTHTTDEHNTGKRKNTDKVVNVFFVLFFPSELYLFIFIRNFEFFSSWIFSFFLFHYIFSLLFNLPF